MAVVVKSENTEVLGTTVMLLLKHQPVSPQEVKSIFLFVCLLVCVCVRVCCIWTDDLIDFFVLFLAFGTHSRCFQDPYPIFFMQCSHDVHANKYTCKQEY